MNNQPFTLGELQEWEEYENLLGEVGFESGEAGYENESGRFFRRPPVSRPRSSAKPVPQPRGRRPGPRRPPRFPPRGGRLIPGLLVPSGGNFPASPAGLEGFQTGNEFVRWVQSSLNLLLGANLRLDGIMSPETRAAISRFQAQEKLPTDGILGPDTRQAIIEARKKKSDQPASQPGSDTPSGDTAQSGAPQSELSWLTEAGFAGELEAGSGSLDSQLLRTAWVQMGLNHLFNTGLNVDGLSSPAYISALKRFQAQQRVTPDGKTSAAIEKFLNQALARRIATNAATYCQVLTWPVVLSNFDFNKDQIKPGHLPILFRLAACIVASQKLPRKVKIVRLVGHTDPVGSASYNLELGRKRAEMVKNALVATVERLSPGLASKTNFQVESMGETKPVSSNAAVNRRVELTLVQAAPPKTTPLAPLTSAEQAEYNKLPAAARAQFDLLRKTIDTYTGQARKEADRGSRALLQRGNYRVTPTLLPEILRTTQLKRLPSGWSLSAALPLLVGNTLYNLAFPETINQGGTDRLGGTPDPTCFSASTQMLLARRFPATYVRYLNELAATDKLTFAGGGTIGPLTFKSTSLYKSLESVLLQTAFDTFFRTKAFSSGGYSPGDELKVHRQVFGATRPPKNATAGTKTQNTAAMLKAFVTSGGNTTRPEIINLCTGNPSGSCGNHTIVLTRITSGRVYFYNPWANEEEKKVMFGAGKVATSGNGERPAESSMALADFTTQITTVFHN